MSKTQQQPWGRVEGLIRSGAVKYEDKPIWFNVYRSFPPKVQPTYNKIPMPNEQVVKILYPEDLVRAKFYAMYSSQKVDNVVNLKDHKTPTVCQRFVDKYFQLKNSKTTPDQDLFETTAKHLKMERVNLKTDKEIKEEQLKKEKQLHAEKAKNIHSEHHMTAEDLFGDKIASMKNFNEETSFSDEEDTKFFKDNETER